jgi:hypothetical protein
LLSAGTAATLLCDGDGEAADVLADIAAADPEVEGLAAETLPPLHATRAARSGAATSRPRVHGDGLWKTFTNRRSQGFDETTMRVGVAGGGEHRH